VEGAADSGSLITAELAQDLGRDVAAVPGPATSPVSAAPLELIRDGGALVRGPADVLELVGVRGDRQDLAAMSLSRREQQVLSGVSGPPTTLDAVAAAIGRPPAEVLAALASLEIKGFVRADAGRYQRTAAAATAG
ncbi:MAG TPA: DNA-processing protein DprA, partial [Actinomycetota bacterium]|nr:DNA-processing protein DprA [Actinomycetota bacterium]